MSKALVPRVTESYIRKHIMGSEYVPAPPPPTLYRALIVPYQSLPGCAALGEMITWLRE